MALDDVKMFHLTSTGKLKEISKKRYLQLLEVKGACVGYVNAKYLLFLKKDHNVIRLRRHQLEQILALWDNQKEA